MWDSCDRSIPGCQCLSETWMCNCSSIQITAEPQNNTELHLAKYALKNVSVQFVSLSLSVALPYFLSRFCSSFRIKRWAITWIQVSDALKQNGAIDLRCGFILPACDILKVVLAPTFALPWNSSQLPGFPFRAKEHLLVSLVLALWSIRVAVLSANKEGFSEL